MVEIGEWSFLDPWLLAAAPVALLCLLWRWRRPKAALPIASAAPLAGLPATLRARLCWLPLGVKVLAAVVLAVALARPVTRDVVPIRSEGVDILLLIDQSSSMLADDMERGREFLRIDAAREQALAFAEARVNDRLGLLTFALFPELRCPLTLDKRALAAFLRAVDTVPRGSPEDRTAIGVALARAVELLEKSTAATKVVVLLTDGENNILTIEPADAAKLASDAGVKVYTIGLGQGMIGPFGGVHEPDFADLEKVAETTGGRFFRARSADDLEAVYGQIDQLERTELEDPRYRTTDWFEAPLVFGALLAALGLLLEMLWIRGVP